MTSGRSSRRGRLGALPPRYSFVLNPHAEAGFTRCPRCEAATRLRKLPLVIHVEHSAGPSLVILNKTCRLCGACEMLIAHDADIARLLAASGFAAEGETPSFFVLGTVARPAWRAGLAGGATLGEVRARMADFKEYMRVDFTPGGWYPATETVDGQAIRSTAAKRPHANSRRAGRS